jgi:hypothetical protein
MAGSLRERAAACTRIVQERRSGMKQVSIEYCTM